jgi:hypothetical protein
MELENIFLLGDGKGPNSSLMIANDDVILNFTLLKEKKNPEHIKGWRRKEVETNGTKRIGNSIVFEGRSVIDYSTDKAGKKKFLCGSRLKLFHHASFFAALSNGKTFERKRATSATIPSRMFGT